MSPDRRPSREPTDDERLNADERAVLDAGDLDDLLTLDADIDAAQVCAAIREPTRIVVVEGHPIMREATAAYLTRNPNLEIVGAAETGARGIELCQRLRPAVVVLDLGLPDMSGLDVLRRLPRPPYVLMQSGMIGRAFVAAALQARASDYIDKATPRLA